MKRIEHNVRERHFEVDQNFEGWRLDEFLENRISGMSMELATLVANEGDVEVDGDDDVDASTLVTDGNTVVVREHMDPEYVQDHQVGTLYTDEALLVVDKPAGMLVHETASVRLNTITHYLKRRGLEEAEPVHRIDCDTSGVLVCARRQKYVHPLRDQFKRGIPKKTYRALVIDDEHRWTLGDSATLDTPLGHNEESVLPHKMGRGDLEAITHVEVLGRRSYPMGDLADLRVEIETGRQHQIRVHLALEGTPIAGDKLYAMDDQFFIAICEKPDDEDLLRQLHFPRHALHARRIQLQHPAGGDTIEVESALPSLWRIRPKSGR